MKLGKLLLKENLVTPDQLETALEAQKARGGPLGRLLVERGYVSESALLSVLARKYAIPKVDLGASPPDPAVASRFFRNVPRSRAAKLRICPTVLEDRKLTLAMADPTDVALIDEVRSMTGLAIEPAFAGEQAILSALRTLGPRARLRSRFPRVKRASERVDFVTGTDSQTLTFVEKGGRIRRLSSTPACDLVSAVIVDGLRQGATAIHIESHSLWGFRVRYRVEGELHVTFQHPYTRRSTFEPEEVFDALFSLAHLDKGHRVLQDGHLTVRFTSAGTESEVELEFSFVPLCWGERCTLRKTRVELDEDPALPRTELGKVRALMAAAKLGQERIVETLLEADTDPNGSGAPYRPLMAAAHGGHSRTVDVLLRAGADTTVTDHGQDTLTLTAFQGHFDTVRRLLDFAGFSPESRGRALELAAIAGHVDIVRDLVQRDVPQNDRVFSQASARGHADVARELLQHWRITDESTWIDALSGAAAIGSLDVVELLLEAAPELDSVVAIVEALLRGARPLAESRSAHLAGLAVETPDPQAEDEPRSRWLGERRHRQRLHQRYHATLRLLLEATDRFRAPLTPGSMATMLGWAIETHNLYLVRSLLEAGAAAMAAPPEIMPPLVVAVDHDNHAGFTQLLDAGAAVTIEVLTRLGRADRAYWLHELRLRKQTSFHVDDLPQSLRWAEDKGLGDFTQIVEK